MIRFIPVFLLCAGCGLSDYEKRMDTQRERLKSFDEENKLLDEPLEMPKLITKTKDEIEAFPFEVFLRPPKDFKTPPAKNPHVFDTVMLFRYATVDIGTLLLGASHVGDPKQPDSGDDHEEFKRKSWGAFRAYHRDVYFQNIPEERPGLTREVFNSISFKGPWPKLEVERVEYIDKDKTKSHTWIYFHRRGQYQAVVVYQIPLDRVSEARKALEFSLKTLAIEPDKVNERKDEFNLRNKYRR